MAKLDGTNGLIQQYDYQVLTTAFSYTFASGTQTLIINPAGTLATGTVTMPAAPADGMVITVESTQIITALTLSGNTGQSIVGAPATLFPNQPLSYVYRVTNTTWYPFSVARSAVLQVVQSTFQSPPFSTTSAAAVSTGITQSITPSSASSKVLVIAYSTLGVPATGMNGHIDLRRGASTTIATDWYVTYGAAAFLNAGFTAVYLDSPATTSSTAYTLLAYRDGAAGTIYVGARQDAGSPVVSSITLMEIAA